MLEFDCVVIYKQPAFQHPLLKHHKIPEKFTSNESFDRKNKYKTNDQSCPKGTLTILRQRIYIPIWDYERSSSFPHVKLTNDKYQSIEAETLMGVADSKCFKLMSRDYTNETGKSFSFGGPGGRCGFFSVPLSGDQVSKDVSHVSCFKPNYINSLEEKLAAMQRDMEELKARQTDVLRRVESEEETRSTQRTAEVKKLNDLKSESVTKTAEKENVTLDASAIEELQHLERPDSLKRDISSGSALKKLFSAHGLAYRIEELCIRDLQRDEAHLVLPTTMEQLRKIGEFDCVDIYKQPAFQHPLLKHHKIPEKFISNKSFDRKSKYKTTDQSCPKGTVAILRQRSETESLHLDTDDHFGHHFAVMDTYPDASIYQGAQADISIHNLTLQNNQLSRSQIWLENGPPGELNSIQVGWAADGYKTTGCYNTNCPGFIIVTRKPSIGSIFKLSSVYGGDKTVIFTPHVYQDVFTPCWALKVDDEMIGYWPGELFTHLKNGASRVRFGGNTYISPDGISPPMGNGHFPLKDYQRSSSFLHVKLTNHRYQTIEAKTILRNADSRCFRLMDRRYTKENGKSFSYGGAGGRCGI
ncbi:hypothetical protein HID58_017404 [Brassica napus]|uniref:Neprosin PEP catalytic domain-containing protein n=1 Tax=Brassica napus TaxID=3708 RepID=A0ABQ8D8P4_BRANA|nr:hypothetical protein HID58_017404 [Brassica napus]